MSHVACCMFLMFSTYFIHTSDNNMHRRHMKASAICLILAQLCKGIAGDNEEVSYGVDVSFPMHRSKVSNNYAWLPHNVDPANNPTPKEYQDMQIQWLGNVQERYNNRMKGCYNRYNKRACDRSEEDRVAMSLRQPKAMQNYTEMGFKKIKTPPDVWKLIKEFWDMNKNNETWAEEKWSKGATYVNSWESPTYMVSVENKRLRGAGKKLKDGIWGAARTTLQSWVGHELTECSLYGIRVYTEGAMLATHVDRLPLVSSAIVNVAQDIDEPWPIEVISHDGKAYNITMEPGDMVLYESHSILHGRPFPLKGRFYANIFIHFEPTGHSLKYNSENNAQSDSYKESIERGQAGHEHNVDGLPDYIKAGSDEDIKWRREHQPEKIAQSYGSTGAHDAAYSGDIKSLRDIAETNEAWLHKKDINGWTPLHEGARAGHLEVVKTLVENGVDVNEIAGIDGDGKSALYLALETHGEGHAIVDFLKSVGAMMIGPEL